MVVCVFALPAKVKKGMRDAPRRGEIPPTFCCVSFETCMFVKTCDLALVFSLIDFARWRAQDTSMT